jgi:hypothetical protein
MTEITTPSPRPPIQLFGLWTVTSERPDGFWWNHVCGQWERHDDTPMTFISQQDAEDALVMERGELEEGEHMEVALIGVAPNTAAGDC